MGKAYTGLADDASAIFTNPAGLARNNSLNIISMSGSLLSDVNYVLLGASDNSRLGKFGVGYINASVAGTPLMVSTGSGSTAAISQVGVADYSSSLFSLSYGSRLSRFLKAGKGNNFAMGLSLKYFLQGFSASWNAAASDEKKKNLQDAMGNGVDADLGFLWEFNPWLTLGLTFQNFLPYSLGGKFTWQKNAITEGIPMVIRVGALATQESSGQRFNFSLDYESGTGQNKPSTLHAGVEYWPLELIALRAGIDQKPKATEAGIGVDNNFTAGVGLVLSSFTFDYAYHQFGDLPENATHFFSIG
ncbi:hypothetical protein HZB08_00030 [Candidatus Saganbacteria bacterium]|uniref:PorV/PorQ family protein n=1 Tax=Candidatus Saganbacteria bacterium TaxID=2575572 RepID=A0A9D6UKA7_UNCSA|nr:hypothetical protein [Candidatus Saganbacteria bacterium]